jgi:transcriptional antiterminator
MSEQTHLSIEEIYNSITKLESLGFLQTIRSGQYFVRRYFTHENDEQFKQSYDDFDI